MTRWTWTTLALAVLVFAGAASGVAQAQSGSSMSPLPPLPAMPPPSGDNVGKRASLMVKGQVTVHIDVICIDVEVVSSNGSVVRAQLSDSPGELRLEQRGSSVDVHFTSPAARSSGGHLRVELPRGSGLELASTSGDVQVHDTYGSVRVRSSSGDLHVIHAASVEAVLISGDITVDDVAGEVRLRTVSGDAHVRQTGGAASKLEFGTTSGDLDWTGACSAGCRLEARSTSGEVRLRLQSPPSFELRYVTYSGDFSDDLHVNVVQPLTEHGGMLRARAGKADGLIEVQTFSGDLSLRK